MGAIVALPHHHHPFAVHPDLYSFGIPALLLIIPWIAVTKVFATNASREFRYRDGVWYLGIAAFTWIWAIQLPNIPISHETESTTMHLLGGLVIGPAIYAYCIKAYAVARPSLWWVRFLVLYGSVGGIFGLSNEILEFTGTKLGLLNVDISDTSWDVFENFVGLIAAFVILEAIQYRLTAWRKAKEPAQA